MTFKPAITKKADRVGARSRISIKDPEKYLQMHKERADKKEEKRKAELERRETEEAKLYVFRSLQVLVFRGLNVKELVERLDVRKCEFLV